jgi:hypothetical protein
MFHRVRLVDGKTERQMDRQMGIHKGRDGHREIQTDKCMYRKADGRIDRWVYTRID